MDYVLQLPAYVKVFSSFGLILVLAALRLHLGLATLIATGALLIMAAAGFSGVTTLWWDFLAPESSLLMAIVFMLMIFSESLRKSGRMEAALGSLRQAVNRPKFLLGGMPALVGLLPMPGGALFSAPLVDAVDDVKELSPLQKVAVNYWFRHLWEYWWPLYPGVVLAIKYSTLPAVVFFAVQIPLTIASLAAGILFILGPIRVSRRLVDPSTVISPSRAARAVTQALWPVGLLVIISLLGSVLLPRIGIGANLANLISMLAALIIAVVLVFITEPRSIKPALGSAIKKETWLLLLVVGGIQLFSLVLKLPDAAGQTLVYAMRTEFLQLGVPIWGVIMLLPFCAGLVTGVAFGFVGISFPLVFALLGAQPSLGELAATTVVAYGFGYIGMTISPIHVCFVVTASYFKTQLYHSYRLLWKPVLLMAAATLVLGVVYYVIY